VDDLDAQTQPARQVRLTQLVFGVAFVAIGAVHLTGALVDDTTWVWVFGLAALAVAGLISAIRS
jgi:dipeptide/tripeptide permease